MSKFALILVSAVLLGSVAHAANTDCPGPEDRQVLSARDVPTVAALLAAATRRIVVKDADLSGQSFAGIQLANVCFVNAKLAHTNWSGATVHNVTFLDSDLTGSLLVRATFRSILLTNSRLDDVDASEAELSDTTVYDGSFDGLVLRKARLQHFEFSCETMMTIGGHLGEFCEWPEKKGIDARGSDLTGAGIHVLGSAWKVDGAVLDQTTLPLRDAGAFRNAQTPGPVIVENGGWFQLGPTAVSMSPAEWRSMMSTWTVSRSESYDPLAKSQNSPPWLLPDADVLFTSWDLPVSQSFKQTALYQRLVPVIVGSSLDYLRVHVNKDRSVTVDGFAKGGGDHFCDVSGTHKYNPKTGWFGALHHTEWLDAFPEGAGKIEDVLRFNGDDVEIESGWLFPMPEYVVCGARAKFAVMSRIEAPKFLKDHAGKSVEQ